MSVRQGILRRFNKAGVAEFVSRLELLRAGGQASIDDAFVTDGKLTETIIPETPLERPLFRTKREAGAYLSERTRIARELLGDDDCGMWTWLAAWNWDTICPVAKDGRRRVLSLFHYVYGRGFSAGPSQRRHLVAVPVRLYELSAHSQLMLETPFHTMPKVVSEISGRLALTRIKALPTLLDILYWDPNTRRQKPGAVNPRAVSPGDLMHRLPARIKQLEMTYDLVDLTADQLLSLLGDEFRYWAVGQRPPKTVKNDK
jgi:hypothetical protein